MKYTLFTVYCLIVLVSGVRAAEETLPHLKPANEPKPFSKQDWEFLVNSCSWYCGAPEIRVSASSYLRERDGLEHLPGDAHDRKLETTWVEGAPHAGAGERRTFTFIVTTHDTTRLAVTACSIASGYQFSQKLFRQNARPRTLQLLYDGRPVALLDLKDSMGLQRFSIPKLPLPRPSRHTITFQILDVYPGGKYDDTCITEIRFDGEGDMH